MNKKQRKLITILVVSLIIISSMFLYRYLISHPINLPYTVTIPSGARTDGTPFVVHSTQYTCNDSDYCDVFGSLICDKSTSSLVVKVRWTGFLTDSIALDASNNGSLASYGFSGSASGSFSLSRLPLLPYNTPQGQPITTYGGRLSVVLPTSSGGIVLRTLNPGGNANTNNAPTGPNGQCSPLTETCVGSSYSQCSWNFVPSPDPNFEYATKVGSSQLAWSGSTSDYLLKKGEYVTFTPKDVNNNPLSSDKFSMTIQKYKVYCAGECSTNQIYCDPPSGSQKCPSGYTFTPGSFHCYWVNGQISDTTLSNICYEYTYQNGIGPYSNCVQPLVDSTPYKLCDGLDSNQCHIFSTQTHATNGEVCKPLNGDIGTSGVGSLVCDANSCVLGTSIPCDGSNNCGTNFRGGSTIYYQTCQNSVGPNGLTCPTYSSTQTCASGLVFDLGQQQCTCPPVPAGCVGYNSQCLSSTEMRTCQDVTIQGQSCKQWSPTINALPGQVCVTDANGTGFQCVNQPCTSINTKSCITGTNTFNQCVIDPQSGCYKYDTTTLSCGNNYECYTDTTQNSGFCRSCDDSDPTTNDTVVNGLCTHTKINGACYTNADCNDNNPLTDDLCIANKCSNVISGTSCTSADLTKCASDQICVANRCAWPTTGAFCDKPTADAKTTACKSNVVNSCQYIGTGDDAGSYKWVPVNNGDCTAIAATCVESG